MDNLSAHKGTDIRHWAQENKVELCFTPTYASWANPIEVHFGPLRQFTTFGRRWQKARENVGMPEGFRFYDLRHTGHTLSTRSGATLKDTMVRAGRSSEKAALIYQHSDDDRQQEVAPGLDATVRKAGAAAARRAPDKPSGTNLARGE